ncbi:MAG: thioredoxin domain-containing protein [Alphaproteobacteria bacterium]|nr:thioredoxin domain-containing protein [Alphaproteobacteria bacterium]
MALRSHDIGVLALALLCACGRDVEEPEASGGARPVPVDVASPPRPVRPEVFAAGPGAPPYDEALRAALEEAWAALPASYAPRTRHRTDAGAPRFTNRLLLSTSPYLRQHAHNPVDWHPWSDAAFEIARRLGRPVLLSVGYSTCHWCHVMEAESFEDLEIAAYINAHTVPIKVDREERPDVDAVYMAAVRRFQGDSGWPMTLWLDADGRPWYGATYLPPRDGERGRSAGLLTVLRRLDEAWRTQPGKVDAVGAAVVTDLQAELERAPDGEPDVQAAIDAALAAAIAGADETWGGLRGAPKFPSHLPLRLMLQEAHRVGHGDAERLARLTLDRMERGGLHDQVGGGFHRYSTDPRWQVPHFEKMLQDNALLAETCLDAWLVWRDDAHARVVRDTLGFLLRDMAQPGGGFASALDADSVGPDGALQEGRWLTWTPAELSDVLSPADLRLAMVVYGIDEAGDVDGRSVLWRERPDAEVAAALGLDGPSALHEALGPLNRTLLAARQARPQPLLDDKRVAAWNGLAIAALARAGLALDEPAWIAAAEDAAAFVLDEMVVDGRLRRIWHAGQARHAAMLEDQADVASGLLALYSATGDVRWLDGALARCAEIEDHHRDPATGGLFRTPDDAEALLARERDTRDGAEPSGTSVHLENLLRLAALTGDARWGQRADAVTRSLGDDLGAFDHALLALDWQREGPREVVLVRPDGSSDDALVRAVVDAGLAAHVLVRVEESKLEAVAQRLPPVADKRALNGRPTAYVCTRGLCRAPTDDPAELTRLLRR